MDGAQGVTPMRSSLRWLLRLLPVFDVSLMMLVFACIAASESEHSKHVHYDFFTSIVDLLVLAWFRGATLFILYWPQTNLSTLTVSLVWLICVVMTICKCALLHHSVLERTSTVAVLTLSFFMPTLEELVYVVVLNSLHRMAEANRVLSPLPINAAGPRRTLASPSRSPFASPARTPSGAPASYGAMDASPLLATPVRTPAGASDIASVSSAGSAMFLTPPDTMDALAAAAAAAAARPETAVQRNTRANAALPTLSASPSHLPELGGGFGAQVAREASRAASTAASGGGGYEALCRETTQALLASIDGGGWRVHKEVSGVRILIDPAKPFAFRAETRIAGVAPEAFCAAWCNESLRHHWDTAVVSRHLCDLDEQSAVLWMKWEMPWPASPRDFVYVRCHTQLDTGAHVLALASIPLETSLAFGVPRATIQSGGLLVAPLPGATPPQIAVTYVMELELGGQAPQALIPTVVSARPLSLVSLAQYIAAVPSVTGSSGRRVHFEDGTSPQQAGQHRYADLVAESVVFAGRVLRDAAWTPVAAGGSGGASDDDAWVAQFGEHAFVRSEAAFAVDPLDARARSVAVLTASLCRAITDPESRRQWDQVVSEMTVLERLGPHAHIIHAEWMLPWPSSKRDFVAVQDTTKGEDGVHHITLLSVDDYTCPSQRGALRAQFLSGTVVTLIPGDNEVRVVFLFNVDLETNAKTAQSLVERIPDPHTAHHLARFWETASS